MLKEEILDTLISQYYDCEMNDYEIINFEARMALSKGIRDYTSRQCYEYFKISNSIKLTKNRAKDKAINMTQRFEAKINSSFININAVSFKSFYKHLRNSFLNALRHNS